MKAVTFEHSCALRQRWPHGLSLLVPESWAGTGLAGVLTSKECKRAEQIRTACYKPLCTTCREGCGTLCSLGLSLSSRGPEPDEQETELKRQSQSRGGLTPAELLRVHSPAREKGRSKGRLWLREPGTSKSAFGPTPFLRVLQTRQLNEQDPNPPHHSKACLRDFLYQGCLKSAVNDALLLSQEFQLLTESMRKMLCTSSGRQLRPESLFVPSDAKRR
ncbi:hypothetical protein EK904_011808 [Melospiza melodia maxima]|nr:hypothetical protein EK904_011808 [Melospiza melodia maxima]